MFSTYTRTATPARHLYQGARSSVLNNYDLEESMPEDPQYSDSGDGVITQAPTAYKPSASRLWCGLTVSRNAQGQDEAFAIGPDGYVWSYLTSPAGHTTGRLISTGLQAHSFALAKLARHRKLLIGAQGASLSWVVETGEAQPRWHEPVSVSFEGLQSAQSISQVHALERDDEILVGVLAHYALGAKRNIAKFWVGKWTGDNLYFMDNPVSLDGSDPIGNEFLYGGLATASVLQSVLNRTEAGY
jgi:hypothetical protein